MTLEEIAAAQVRIDDISKPGNPRYRVHYFGLYFDSTDARTAEMSARPIRRHILQAMQKALDASAPATVAILDKIVDETRGLMTAPDSDFEFRLRAASVLGLIRDQAADEAKRLRPIKKEEETHA